MQRISVNLTNACSGNQLNCNNDLPPIQNKNYALQKPFKIDFLTQYSAMRNCDRHSSFFVEWPKTANHAVAWGTRFCTILFAIIIYLIICENYFIVKLIAKYILWYLLELSYSFDETENSVLPILTEKNFKQKIYHCPLKMGVFFLRREIQFFRLHLRDSVQ